MKLHRKARRGFSLLEITLVLVIIGVLAAVAAVSLSGQGYKAKRRATIISMTTIKNAIDTYKLEHSTFPPTLLTLATGASALLDGKKLKDAWKQEFVYSVGGTEEQPYQLTSRGDPDKPDDDISVWTMDKE